MMTQPEQRIALAEWMGWTKVDSPTQLPWGATAKKPTYYYIHELPDYPNDLNACHEVEIKLAPVDEVLLRRRYIFELMNLVGVSPDMQGKRSFVQDFGLMHATSKQRTEALCRTLFPERFE